jgi:hypothetical protein
MRLLNASGNKTSLVRFVLLSKEGRIVPVKFINPEVGWFRIFRRPDGSYVGKDDMKTPEGWRFIESRWLSENDICG